MSRWLQMVFLGWGQEYSLLAIPLLLLEWGLCRWYRRKGWKVSWGFLIGWQVLACYLMVVLSITGAADVTDLPQAGTHILALEELNLIPLRWGIQDPKGLALNGVLFLPLGLFLPLLWKEAEKWKTTAALGFGVSMLIELSQLFNFRATDIDDLIMNTLGTVAGWGIYRLLFRKVRLFQLDTGGQASHSGAWSLLLIFGFRFLIGGPMLIWIWSILYP